MSDLILSPNHVSMIDPLDPAGPRVKCLAWDRDVEESVDGSINQYAYGRRVSVSYSGVNSALKLTLIGLSVVEYATMREWLGHITLFRDRHGRKVYGTYFSIEVKDFRDSEYDISFQFDSVTFDEAV